MQRSGEWIAFSQERYCRRLTLYEMQWEDVSFYNCVFSAAASYGGPIAIAADTFIHVYTASGLALGEFSIPPDAGMAVAGGWTNEEALLVLTSTGHALLFELSNTSKGPSFSVSLLSSELKCNVVRPFGAFVIGEDEVACLIVQERKDPSSVNIALDGALTAPPSCIEVLPAELSEDDETWLYIAPSLDDDDPETILVVNISTEEVTDLELSIPSGVARMRLNHSGTLLALITYDGYIRIVSSNFHSFKYLVKLRASLPPLSMHWCGEEFLFVTYSPSQFDDMEEPTHFSLLVPILQKPDPQSKCEKLNWDLDGCGIACCVTDVDGVRVTTDTSSYLIESVPSCLINLFRINSNAQSAKLAKAYNEYIKGDVNGFTAIKKISERSDFCDVLDEILDAAAHEFGAENQEKLLAIVGFCKNFTRVYDSDLYADMCKRLKALNAVRAPECGIPVSFRQYQNFTGSEKLRYVTAQEAQVLVDRLINRKQFQLACDLAAFFKMKLDKVLMHWSSMKVRGSQSDEEIYNEVVSVLSKCPGVGFTEAATTAFQHGKEKLAIQLLSAEPRSRSQVLLFLEMKQDDLALQKAVSSDDTDLMNLVLLKLLLSPRTSDMPLFALVARSPVARSLFITTFVNAPRWKTLVRRFREEIHDQHMVACDVLDRLLTHPVDEDSIDTSDDDVPFMPLTEIDNPITSIDEVQVPKKALCSIAGTETITVEDLQKCAAWFAQSNYKGVADALGDAKACTTAIDLLSEQKKLVSSYKDLSFNNEALTGTIRLCFIHHDEKKAEQLKAKYNMPEKKYWYVKLRALAENGQWDAIDKMGGVGNFKSKVKSPIGFRPFVEELSKYADRHNQTALFVAKLDDVCERVEWYVKLGHLKEAIDTAFEDEDIELLAQIRKRSGDQSTINYIDKKMKQLE